MSFKSFIIIVAISRRGLARPVAPYVYGDIGSGVGGRGVPLRGNKGYKPTINEPLFVGV